MRKVLIIFLVMAITITGCHAQRETKETSNTEITNEEKPNELTVYTVGDMVSGKVGGEKVEYHHTGYTVGPFGPLTNGSTTQGHMLYSAFRSFEQKTGITLNVQYFSNMVDLENQVLEDRKSGTGPDVIIVDFHGWAVGRECDNIYRLIYNGWFTDMLPYLELDEVYESDDYYNEVLQAGMVGEKQYILPLSFNMNALFSSEEDMEELGVTIEEGADSAQLLEQLEYACNMAQEGEQVVDQLSLWSWPSAIIQDYWESTGLKVADYENREATINRELFEKMAVFFKQFLKMNIVEDWETVLANAQLYMEDENWGPYITPGRLETLDGNKGWAQMPEEVALEWMNQGVFYYENSALSMFRHALPGQCTALSTIYEDLDEQMVMVSVPMYKESDKYMAQVQLFGGILADSESPYHSYQLLKHLLDQKYDPYYTITLKKENAEKMLDQLSSSVYTLYIGLGAVWLEGIDFSKEVDVYDLQPLPEDLKKQLQHMLDNIGGAVLPESSVYEPLVWHLEAYAFELETLDEAYENAGADLEEHLNYVTAGDSMIRYR